MCMRLKGMYKYNPYMYIYSDVLEHKWRACLKTILFYMNDFDF